MADRRSSVVFLGNDNALNATLARIEGKLKALSDVAEEQNAKIAESSQAASVKMGRAYEEGTAKAGASLKGLSKLGADLGVPMSNSLNAVGKKLDETSAKGEKLRDSLAALGKVTLVAGLGGFAAAAYEGVKGATQLQKSMEMLHTQAGATQKQVAQLQAAVLNMAGSVGTAPNELAQGLYHIVSNMNAVLPAAQRNTKELQALRIAAEGAKVGNANLEDVTNALGAAIASGLPGVQNYQKAMGMLNATVGAGDMRMQDLADALGTGLLGPMKNYGISLKDVSAALAVFGDNNIRGQEAATKLNSAIRIMAAPSSAAAKALGAINLSSTQLANDMRSGGLIKAIEDLKTHLADSGATASQQALIITRAFGGRQSTGVQLLMGQLDRLKAKYKEVGDGANSFAGSWRGTQQTLAQQMDQLKAAVQALADKFGLYLIPKLEATAHAVNDVVTWFGKHKAAAEALAIVIGGVLGTAVTVFAYTKAVAFVGATKDMVGGLSNIAKSIASTLVPSLGTAEAANATAAASFTAVGTEAATAAGEVETQVASMAAAVETEDAAIEASNRAAGASFMALLGPIGLAVGAATAAEAIFHKSVAVPKGGIHFANAADARNYLQSQGVPGAAIPQLISQMQHAGDIGGLKNTGTGAGLGGPSASQVNAATGATGGWSSGSIPVPSSGSNAQRIAAALKAQGFSDVAIAGILGNFAQETGGGSLSGINTRDTGTGASGVGGMGIAQWTAQRRQDEIAYAQQHHEAPTSLNAQIGYLIAELRTGYHNAFNAIQNAKSPQQAAHLFDQLFEGGTDPNGIRESAAAQAYQMLGSSSGKRTPSKALQNYLNGTSSTASKTSTIPVAVVTMLQTAQALLGTPYSKAGHAAAYDPIADLKKIGIDCSGFVSRVLHSGGVSLPVSTTQGLPNYLAKGQGKYVTVYDRHTGAVNDEHTLIEIMGKYFESGGNPKYNPGSRVTQLTAAQAKGELSGGGFEAFHPILGGPNATYKQLQAAGLSSSGQNQFVNVQALVQAADQAIAKAANELLQRLSNAVQSGTLRSLSSALGENTSTMVTTPGVTRTEYGRPVFSNWGSTTRSVAARLHSAIGGLGDRASVGQINRATTGLVEQGSAGSTQEKAFQAQVLNLELTGQTKLAEKLVAAHKAAMQALGQEMYAEQVNKDAEGLALQSQKLADQTTAITDAAQNQANILTAQYQGINDKAQAQVTAIRDMSQIVTDRIAAMVQSVQDHTQIMSDSMSAVATGINDQTQTQVDILGERGLFGLNLIAQQQKVALDQQKTADDKAIAAAQLNLDQVTASGHQLEANAQISLDQVTAAQDQVAALAQQRADTVAVNQQIRLASAQAKLDANTLHNDVSLVGPAQIAVDLGATLPKAQQDVLNAQLKKAQGEAGTSEGAAAKAFAGIQASVNQITAAAQQQAATAQSTAQQQIGAAQATLDAVTGAANLAIAAAQGTLTSVQGTAGITEAGLSGTQAVTSAEASTQYAGSGLIVNITGINPTDASAIASEVGWAMRTNIPA